jgi:tRNA dimethylallyltransferase
LEVNILSGKNMSAFWTQKKPRYDFELCLLEMPREELYRRIDKRCRDIVENGLIEETRKVLEIFERGAPGLSAIGYKLAIDFLDAKISKEFLIEEFSRQTRRYAKRQITWFKRQN